MSRYRIHISHETPSASFRTLADFAVEKCPGTGRVTATELTRRMGEDPATVVRLAQEPGCSGFRQLSRAIKNCIDMQPTRSTERKGLVGRGWLERSVCGSTMPAAAHQIMKADAEKIAEIVQLKRTAQLWTAARRGCGLGRA